jgi:hypothetical protein
MSYRALHVLLAHGRIEGALPHLVTVITTAPGSPEATLAAERMVEAWGDEVVAQALAAAGELSEEDAAALLDGVAAALEEEGRAEEAAALRE